MHSSKSNSNATELYELSTVPYPMPINGIFVTKHLDFWRNGRFRQGNKLIDDRTRNLAGLSCSLQKCVTDSMCKKNDLLRN